ncbi:DUF3800 domain-containing protein [Agromyces bauzanensis]|uniref:DUF3800 domain-containing protein n=1 Tax=Agromyces bauzanensis TaxID=1308924 RepID=A0A917PKX9_9MICO|nr:DUF3800 domain-containing protein [Agromyces bauzanensis]GGJ83171.1 hypothetical protein GCM10011372_21830 [Agromyces bauzanensis]
MLVAYLDEFGNVGPYIEPGHPKYGQHPVFGYAGFILPANNARDMGAEFKRVKTSLFKTEIDKSSAPAQWERKGSEYFTTGSIAARPEQIRAFRGLIHRLRSLDGHLFYYGDEKVPGTLKQTGRDSQAIMHDALREMINRLCTHADKANQDLLILMDSFTDKTRQELAARMYAHIYSRRRPEMKRIIEAPLHIESKLNSGIQFADWICALTARASHFQLSPGSEFSWAAGHFRATVAGGFTLESKLHLRFGEDIHNSQLFQRHSARHAPPPGSVADRVTNMAAIYAAAQRQHGGS